MRLVFMGTPDFAKACLETLYTDGFDIAAVYTKIDTPKNRGMKLIPSPVKEYALSVGLPVYQPQSFRDEETVQQLRELKPDLLVVVAYGKILPQAVLDIPTHGAINMHGSILPELRGSAPVQRVHLPYRVRQRHRAFPLSPEHQKSMYLEGSQKRIFGGTQHLIHG